jgi:hypothetical protein
MKAFLPLLGAALLLGGVPLEAGTRPDSWAVTSPNHAQTFAYGSERHRAWMTVGRHLAVAVEFTNDPYVDQDYPRRYDDFTFDFPNVVLGADDHTFYYRPSGKSRAIAVATRKPGLFGEQVSLLPSSDLLEDAPHGFLTLTLLVGADHPVAGL